MTVQYNEVQELLRSRADLQARLNLMPYDGTPEIKERGGGKYLYVRKRVANCDMVKDLAQDILLEALKVVSKRLQIFMGGIGEWRIINMQTIWNTRKRKHHHA